MQSRSKPVPTRITIALLGAFTIGALPQTVFGQESLPAVTVTAAKDGNDYVAPTSGSATKTEMALRDVPQTINVVPAAVIRDQHALSIQDVMTRARPPCCTAAARRAGWSTVLPRSRAWTSPTWR